jgi:hypothetical protein
MMATMSVEETYLCFAREEADGNSTVYRDWALGVATDPVLSSLIATMPEERQQPNLIFAAARLRGSPVGPFDIFREWLVAHWVEARGEALTRSTQTNEPGRCAVLLPLLSALSEPLALLEVGASAGLCLYPDRYSYRYDGGDDLDPYDGPSDVRLECATTGPVPPPARVPRVVWRAGIDLNPLDVNCEDAVNWLRALVWPGQHDRLRRLDAALAIARQDLPRLIRGDLNASVAALAVEAPAGATLVIFHSGVLSYLAEDERRRFVETVSHLNAHWISNEGPSVVAFETPAPRSPDPSTAMTLLALDGHPRAYAGSHGQSLHWIT